MSQAFARFFYLAKKNKRINIAGYWQKAQNEALGKTLFFANVFSTYRLYHQVKERTDSITKTEPI